MKDIVKQNNLKVRSQSFYESLYEKFHWFKPIKHKCFSKEYDSQPLREPSSTQTSILIIIAGTPHDWFQDDRKYSLHLAINEINIFFNDYYCNYLNQKYACEPKEKETAFVPLDNIDLSNILCIRDKRIILNGNMISWNNNYYQTLDKDNSIKQIYKCTEIHVLENVLTKVVKVKYYNIFYDTKQIEGHRQDPEKKKTNKYSKTALTNFKRKR